MEDPAPRAWIPRGQAQRPLLPACPKSGAIGAVTQSWPRKEESSPSELRLICGLLEYLSLDSSTTNPLWLSEIRQSPTQDYAYCGL
jgi:hypothetical protein